MSKTYAKKIRNLLKFMRSSGAPAALVSQDFIAILMTREALQGNLSHEQAFDAVDRNLRKNLANTVAVMARFDEASRRLAEVSDCPFSEVKRTMVEMVKIGIMAGNSPHTSCEYVIQQTDVLAQHVKSGRIKVLNGKFSLADIKAAYPQQTRH